RGGRLWLCSSGGRRSLWQADFRDGDWIIFGSESRGIDPAILTAYPDQVIRIPQSPGERCLNLATAAGIVLYEALRQLAGTQHPSGTSGLQ
ncbi:MAG TPA: TrmH family RNA methyltransferase, partial [Tepidisphaeraceae bacterium]|nr:TrmH family RNA methyltransferase [Tepidisphaeraceae bacterium]